MWSPSTKVFRAMTVHIVMTVRWRRLFVRSGCVGVKARLVRRSKSVGIAWHSRLSGIRLLKRRPRRLPLVCTFWVEWWRGSVLWIRPRRRLRLRWSWCFARWHRWRLGRRRTIVLIWSWWRAIRIVHVLPCPEDVRSVLRRVFPCRWSWTREV